MDNRKIIAVDFDGVLHSFASGWTTSTDLPDPPTEGAIAWLSALINSPYKIVIFSSRNEDWRAIQAMQRWLIKYGMNQLNVGKLQFPTKKPACHILIDDRCFCFKGKFPTLDELDKFSPWHGNGVW